MVATTQVSAQSHSEDTVIEVQDLSFSYPGIDGRPLPGVPPVVQNMTVSIARGSRCLLIGPNGAGKTTLLKALAGKHMVTQGSVLVADHSPFHHTELTTSGDLAYLGGNWVRDIAFAGYSIPLQGDFPAGRMIDGVPGVPAERKALLTKVLDVDPEWRMHRVSDGQRRRVQLLLGLLQPFKVLFLDEITVDLDVLGRADLLAFLQDECEQRHATIIYATHIFDGLESWPTHLIYLSGGRLQLFAPTAELPEMHDLGLLKLVERWLRKGKQQRKQAEQQAGVKQHPEARPVSALPQWSNGYAPGRLTSSLKDSSNAVMRM
ncbi:hypothetical protein WJX73_004373 [Symbiochloris irregularis]|uniref:ABC transporter domain-containing protein n=1 Tax=Symbiochloris irregularis TaxID=706552 RepID=A0AAW1NXF9_9CHLO